LEESVKKYCVGSHNDNHEYIEILDETEDEFIIRYVRVKDGIKKITQEAMTRHLFNICLNTGWLSELDADKSIA
jgi:hypothetical protein